MTNVYQTFSKLDYLAGTFLLRDRAYLVDITSRNSLLFLVLTALLEHIKVYQTCPLIISC